MSSNEAKREARDVRVEATEVRIDESANRLWAGVRLLIWISVVLGVLLAANLFRSYRAQDTVEALEETVIHVEEVAEETGATADQARVSADNALKELRAAIAAIESTNSGEPELNNQAINDALLAIARLEGYICGGQCPETG